MRFQHIMCISDVQWLTAQLSVITYLADDFRTLPSLAFYQPSSEIQDNLFTTAKAAICIPTKHLIRIYIGHYQ
jgi:hypothetical protein